MIKRVKYSIYLLVLVICVTFASCIKNDMPYPVVEMLITSVAGDGFTMLTPDNDSLIVTLELEEKTDIRSVNIQSVSYSQEATLSNKITGEWDFRTPLYVTLSHYQNYHWTIRATQDIERYFTVEGQVGSAVFDYSGLTARVNISNKRDLTDVTITSLKLGPADITTMTPTYSNITDFSQNYRAVNVTYHDRTERWELYVDTIEVHVTITKCDAWSTVAWLEAIGDTEAEHGFQYRKSGDATWIEVDPTAVESTVGGFAAKVEGLVELTEYEFLAYCDGETTESFVATTQACTPLEDADFEQWNKSSSTWYPYASGSVGYWGTGNPGASIAGENLTTPSTDIRPGSTGVYSAELQSKKVMGVKLAAGNLFIGRYVATKGTNGIVGFGHPFVSRPTALKGWIKYSCGIVDNVGTNPPGREFIEDVSSDEGMIYAAVGTWTVDEYGVTSADSAPDNVYGTESQPLIVDTRATSTFFDPTADAVVGYGEMVLTESVSEWQEFTIPLDYTTTSVVPTHIIIVCSASRYGDYFTGSAQSCMWLDDLELVY